MCVCVQGDEWGSGLLCSAVKLAWAVLLRECSTHNAFTGERDGLLVVAISFNVLTTFSLSLSLSLSRSGVEQLEDDESLLDQAVVGGAFSLLWRCIQTPHFHNEVDII